MHKLIFLFLSLPWVASAQLNSSLDEQSPVLHPNQTELYFTIAGSPLNVSGIRDKGDVWVSMKENDKWGAPVRVNGLINNGGYNAVLGFSQDGDEMFLYGHYTANGDASGSQGIAVSRRNGNTWSLPKNETIPYFLNKSIATGGSITSDKKIFVFSAEGRAFDSFGNEDIYVSFNRDGVWTEPLNLGETVNTASQEFSPYYDYNGTLFFSSNKPGGKGSFDVYQCDRLDDTWQNWTTPKLVDVVNSEGRELYFRSQSTLGNTTVLFTSTKNSDGYGDIKEEVYRVPAEADLLVVENVVEEGPATLSDENNRDILVFGKVADSQTGASIAARIVFKPHDLLPVLVDANGQYRASVPRNSIYFVTVEAKGYIAQDEQIRVEGNSKDLEINFKLQPIAVGVSVNLKHVLFRQSSPELLPESYDELDKVVVFLKENPSIEIELAGHTDDAGKASLNLKLSRDRVNRVKYYLVEKGIAGVRVKGVGYGESRPIASNKTDDGRKMNRRVEFKIIKK